MERATPTTQPPSTRRRTRLGDGVRIQGQGIASATGQQPMAHVDAGQRFAALVHHEAHARKIQHADIPANPMGLFVVPDPIHPNDRYRHDISSRHGRSGMILGLLIGMVISAGSVGIIGARLGWWGQSAPHTALETPTADQNTETDAKNKKRTGKVAGNSKLTLPTFRLSDPSRRDDVIAGVRSGSTLLSYCFRRAKVQGELRDGTHTVYLDWMIQPQGTVRSAKIVAPKALAGTAFAQCISETMEDLWHFSPAPTGVSVHGFPLGPIDVY